jgi:GT2 family glycosyltransferase
MISFIIINYRQKVFLEKCVHSILKHIKSFPFEIIILNNSCDEGLSGVEKLSRNILVVSNENKGFSQANNLGVKFSSYPVLFFLNADTEITKDFFKELFREIPGDFGAAGPGLIYPDGTFQLSSWKENTFLNEIENKKNEKIFKADKPGKTNPFQDSFKSIKEVDWVSGAAMIIRKEVFINTEGFDERFFLFYEDADLCKRVKETGLKIFYYPGADIMHHKGENINKNFYSGTYFHAKESQILYYKKHNSFFDNLLLRVYLFLKFAFLSVLTFKKINFRIFLLSIGFKIKK